MTPAAIIRQAMAEGVMLTLSATDTIKASGDPAAVNRWLPIIRKHKPAIVKTLLETSASTGDLESIRAWLAFIGENDPAIIDQVLNKCRTDGEAHSYFIGRAKERTR